MNDTVTIYCPTCQAKLSSLAIFDGIRHQCSQCDKFFTLCYRGGLWVGVPALSPEETSQQGNGWKVLQEKRKKSMTGMDLILAERKRQIEVEGCTAEHDDEYENCELYDAAWCYMMNDLVGINNPDYLPFDWPWDKKWWKPRDHESNLIRAGALLMAEQDRLSRMIKRIADEIDHKIEKGTVIGIRNE